ncbi:uncharacterized protein FRV6_01144 [Fusarium oxysporum]|uniref:PARP catalytic domain-containing protein n=1 Tax=Fusarium oxysporum TaxID=5507 RepID=A0A2H3SKB6_FUSOX|nr:uncharacterized protein FRV6_01144 [Fusarium oxysporum]
MPIRMKRLSRSDPNYKDHEFKFYHSWCHDEKSAKVKSIYLASRDNIDKSYRGQRFFTYLNGGSYKRLYHGTSRACHIGESGNDLKLCHDDDCGTCGILRQSFKLKYADDEGMFGPGIYSTPNSSKADVYVKNHYVSSNLHAMLICYVVASKPQRKLLADHDITRPSRGFNCIEGVTINNGGSLQYPEFVVYREDAIVPVGLIMYTRKGWEPL